MNDPSTQFAVPEASPDEARHRPAATRVRLSVIVPVRNCAEHLTECLSGLRRARVSGVEVIVVDDASIDQTVEVAREFGTTVVELVGHHGPAAARNAGATIARGELLLFVDADVRVLPNTISTVLKAFDDNPDLSAIFGSYDRRPTAPNLVSQYRNLLHHHVHQRAREEASTFWAGCGAVRREVFWKVGGFGESYRRACIEDIEFGMRLRKSGYRIRLVKELQVTHLKRWTLWRMLRADIRDRAIPWSRLILRERSLPNDLNLERSQRWSGVLAMLVATAFLTAVWNTPTILILPLLAAAYILIIDSWTLTRRVPSWLRWASLAALLVVVLGLLVVMPLETLLISLPAGLIVWLNRHFYRFCAVERHPLFAVWVFPLHLLYYLYSASAFAYVVAIAQWLRPPCSPAATVCPPQVFSMSGARQGQLQTFSQPVDKANHSASPTTSGQSIELTDSCSTV